MSAALQQPSIAPGIIKGLSFDDYAAIPAVRSSELKGFARSALHARHAMLHPEETAAKIVGQAVHVALLEPERFDATYAAAPKLDLRTNAGKAAWSDFRAANAGKLPLKPDEFQLCRNLAVAALEHPIAGALLRAPGFNEPTLVWHDAETKLACKARPDRLCQFEGFSTLVEVKTTRDASPRAFAADAARLGYHVQAAWYLRGADALAPVARRFVFLALEKEPPYAVACYELDEQFLMAGKLECDRALRAYANASDSGVWPGYPLRLSTLYAPAWLNTPELEEIASE